MIPGFSLSSVASHTLITVGLLHTLTGRRRPSLQGLRNRWADQSVAVGAPGRGVGWSYSPAQLFEGGGTTYRKIQQYIHVPFTTNLIIFFNSTAEIRTPKRSKRVRYTIIIRILHMIQSNLRNSIPGIYSESNST